MKEIDLLAGHLFKDALPDDFFSYDMSLTPRDGFISFIDEWLREFPTPDVLVFDAMTGSREEVKDKLIKNNILYRVRKISKLDRYVVFLRDFSELLAALKTAIFEINNGYEGYIFIERSGAIPNFFAADLNALIPIYKYTLFLFDDGFSLISNDQSLSAIEKVKATFPGHLKINVSP